MRKISARHLSMSERFQSKLFQLIVVAPDADGGRKLRYLGESPLPELLGDSLERRVAAFVCWRLIVVSDLRAGHCEIHGTECSSALHARHAAS